MMTFDVEEKKASKCFLCDGEPKCVKHCPAAAIRYVPWMDRTGDDRARASTATCRRKTATSAASAIVD